MTPRRGGAAGGGGGWGRGALPATASLFCVGVRFGWLVVPPAFRHPISAVFSSLSAIPSFFVLLRAHRRSGKLMGADLCFFFFFCFRARLTSACVAGAGAVGAGAAVGGGGHGRGRRPQRHGRRARAPPAARPRLAARRARRPAGRRGPWVGCPRWHGRRRRPAGACPARARGGRGGVAGGGPRGGSARTGSRRSPRCLTAPLSRGVRRDGAALQSCRARRAGGPPGGCRRRLALSFETSLTGKKVKGHRPAGRHEVNARTPPPLAYKNILVLASNTLFFGWSGAAAPTTRSSSPSRRQRCAKSSRPAGGP